MVLLALTLTLTLALAGCGGDDGGSGDNGGNGGQSLAGGGSNGGAGNGGNGGQGSAGGAVSPRQRPQPEGDPQVFEAPFSVGDFVRQTLQGQPTATRTGGQRATYRLGDVTATLSVYHYRTGAEAADAVDFVLGGSTIKTVVEGPYLAASGSYGIAQDRHGNYLAAWSRGGWYFLLRTTGDRAALDAFLAVFPY